MYETLPHKFRWEALVSLACHRRETIADSYGRSCPGSLFTATIVINCYPDH